MRKRLRSIFTENFLHHSEPLVVSALSSFDQADS
jgi:hypothetical protein